MQTLVDPYERASQATPAPRPAAPAVNGKVETPDRRPEPNPSKPPEGDAAEREAYARMRYWCSED